MYIDARKFKYPEPLSTYDQLAQQRDKREAKRSYKTWIEDNADQIVDRLWEIDDIGVVEQVGEFVKLLKEAEFTFSLGVYRSAIALIGITAEDLCRFFADLSGNSLDHLTQYNRINHLEQHGLISTSDAAIFHRIRGIRNDCLHFNASFKAKSDDDLKSEALSVVNDLKQIYANLIGVTAFDQVDASKLSEITSRLAAEAAQGAPGDTKNLDEAVMRTRNIFAEVTGIDVSMNLGGEGVFKWSVYKIIDIDFDGSPAEITLSDQFNGLLVAVDLTEDEVHAIKTMGLASGQNVIAAIRSITNRLGMTAEWRFVALPVVAPSEVDDAI